MKEGISQASWQPVKRAKVLLLIDMGRLGLHSIKDKKPCYISQMISVLSKGKEGSMETDILYKVGFKRPK